MVNEGKNEMSLNVIGLFQSSKLSDLDNKGKKYIDDFEEQRHGQIQG